MKLTNNRVILGNNEQLNQTFLKNSANQFKTILINNFNNNQTQYIDYLQLIGYEIFDVNVNTGENVQINFDNYNEKELMEIFEVILKDRNETSYVITKILEKYDSLNKFRTEKLNFCKIVEKMDNNNPTLKSSIDLLKCEISKLENNKKIGTGLLLKEKMENLPRKLAIVLNQNENADTNLFTFLTIKEIVDFCLNHGYILLDVYLFYKNDFFSINIYNILKKLFDDIKYSVNFIVDGDFLSIPYIVKQQELNGDSFLLCGSIHETIQKEELNIIKNINLLHSFHYGDDSGYLANYNKIIIPKNYFFHLNAVEDIYEKKIIDDSIFYKE
jgi:hypothetical protein